MSLRGCVFLYDTIGGCGKITLSSGWFGIKYQFFNSISLTVGAAGLYLVTNGKMRLPGCQATYIGETGRNLNTRLTEHKRATRNGDLNNNIAEHHLQTDHRIDWDSAECVIYSTDYYQRLTLESWFTNLEQTPLNRCQQLPAPYKRLINDTKTDKQ